MIPFCGNAHYNLVQAYFTKKAPYAHFSDATIKRTSQTKSLRVSEAGVTHLLFSWPKVKRVRSDIASSFFKLSEILVSEESSYFLLAPGEFYS